MRSNSSHIIKRQVLDIQTNIHGNAYQMQNNVRELFYAKMMGILEEAFNQYDTGDLLRIDQLTIDLGEVSWLKMDEEMIRAFEGKLHEQLCRIIYNNGTPGSGEGAVKIERIARSKSDLELITTFLKTGVLPWWKERITLSELEQVFDEQIRKNPEAVKVFFQVHAEHPAVLKRLGFQFSEKIIRSVRELFISGKPAGVVRLVTDLERIFFKLIQQQILPKKVKTFVFHQCIRMETTGTFSQREESVLFHEWVALLQEETGIEPIVLAEAIRKHVIFANAAEKKNYSRESLDVLKKMVAEYVPELKRRQKGSRQERNTGSAESNELNETFESVPKQKKRESAIQKKWKQHKNSETGQENKFSDGNLKKKKNPDDKYQESEMEFSLEKPGEVYINNAGLVLIWSYLPFYFKNVGLMADGQFKNEEARYRAAQLLHYIATGEETGPEYELPLNKLLCGISLEEPIDYECVLTETEKKEAEVMLQTVVDHWGALGKTSPLALRQSFLGRKGMLIDTGTYWVLRVEDSGIDILLEKLPWGYSIIQFKWMEKPIHVEWR